MSKNSSPTIAANKLRQLNVNVELSLKFDVISTFVYNVVPILLQIKQVHLRVYSFDFKEWVTYKRECQLAKHFIEMIISQHLFILLLQLLHNDKEKSIYMKREQTRMKIYLPDRCKQQIKKYVGCITLI